MDKLPEKWCILVTEENLKEVTKWYKRNITLYNGCKIGWKPGINGYFHYPQYTHTCHTTSLDQLKGYSIITSERLKENNNLVFKTYI